MAEYIYRSFNGSRWREFRFVIAKCAPCGHASFLRTKRNAFEFRCAKCGKTTFHDEKPDNLPPANSSALG